MKRDKPSRLRLAGLVVAALALTALIAAAVGYAGAVSGSFDWELAAAAGTAAGTSLLGAATFWLGWESREAAALAREEIDIAQKQLEAATTPVVVLVSTPSDDPACRRTELAADLREDQGVQYVHATLRNIGNSPAVIEMVGLRESWNTSLIVAEKGPLAIAPNESLEALIYLRNRALPPTCAIDVWYMDIAGRRQPVSRARLGPARGDLLPILGIAFYRSPGTPGTRSGSDDVWKDWPFPEALFDPI